jgi:hypothetical protein
MTPEQLNRKSMDKPLKRISVPNNRLRELEESFASLLLALDHERRLSPRIKRAYAKANNTFVTWYDLRTVCEEMQAARKRGRVV